MHPKRLFIKDFLYKLPEERIAKYPLPQRDESKLLVYKDQSITEDTYYNLEKYIPGNSLLIFNNTKVVEARLLFQKSTGSIIEIFCLEPADIYADITTAMLQKGKVLWKCLIGGAKKWKDEPVIKIIKNDLKEFKFTAKKIEKFTDYFLIAFSWDDDSLSFAEVLHAAGSVPLPPYLNRTAEETDKERYQTIYAKYNGSVAAPTAGLHFTERLFQKLDQKNIQRDFVTLHVGAGTFKPVKAAIMEEHEMHTEFIDVRAALIENILQHIDKTVIAVGTTSLRTIESLYWLGVKTILNPTIYLESLQVYQWDAYDVDAENISAKDALQALLQWMKQHNLSSLITKTQIIIAPGYALKIAKALITNFHQPQSTLLLLVAAIIGDDWRRVYNYALENNFRFLSYGDGCLLYPVAV
ncbi:S-adenosylmethionine:tRNA ribosyltransferase-isomerase [Panacibacter ginsenosidivorans]|uniref:S-adenosylmethionine:tRNA ribosyltransferase-isomerase n=1 Tax=Panacibacter ginsenosidivorans TaxID=1813871 RepID=A0A5B8V6N6_9BACT|nr:S-adenosylmethionine:tRNA ribosyltransferase-isomerase [Panacibacter ginsenosidivorans]QEC66879.1 S-adenosylmethionine:tRNA ribosyltransferase-isomerase [Panacibacter ginsenosidivorans]